MNRLADVVLSALGLAVLGPVLVLAALAVRLDSPGPSLFRQTRVGRGARPFRMNKFRSMVVDAETRGGYATRDGDARVTRVGRILRSTSADELPQLWNVLVGDMRLVGPRPDVPAQESLYDPADWRRRTSVRPGVTGLAQMRLRSEASPAERLRLDLDWIDDPSFARYLRILAGTARRLATKLAY